jgi:hypothetical protein
MNEPGNDLPNVSRPVDAENSIEGLRRQVNLMFAALLICSFILTAFLALQAKRASADLAEIRAHAVEQYNENRQDVAAIQANYARLAEFGRTHPDFQKQILSRYVFDNNPPVQPAKK